MKRTLRSTETLFRQRRSSPSVRILMPSFPPPRFSLSPSIVSASLFVFLFAHYCQSVCVPYVLDNECSVVVSPLVSSPIPQQLLFDLFLAQTISDIRMFPSQCRRSLIWYLCNSAYPMCDNVTGSVCPVSAESCDYVYSQCETFPNITKNLNCGVTMSCPEQQHHDDPFLFPPSLSLVDSKRSIDSESPCVKNLSSSFIDTTPIPVVTCISVGLNDTIPCCPTPYVRHSNGECVIQCLQYGFGESRENDWALASLIMVWVASSLYIFAIIPSLVLSNWLQFPTVAVHSMEVCCFIIVHTSIWATYEGPQQYICGGEAEDYTQKFFYDYLSSSKCLAQSWIISYFQLAFYSWLFVLSLNTIALILGYSFSFCIDSLSYSFLSIGLNSLYFKISRMRKCLGVV